MRVSVSRITLIALFAVGTACASSGAVGTPRVSSANPDLITSAEISKLQVNTAYDIIARLRPRWLQSQTIGSIGGGARTQVIAVYLDGNRVGAQDGLRSISSNGIQSMQYYDAARAATVLRTIGSEAIAGAIAITTTRSQ